MRVLRNCFTCLLLVSCPVMMRAVTIRILDPSYTNLPLSPPSFNFIPCAGQGYEDKGNLITSDGCFGAVNQTGSAITSITLTFENTTAIQGAVASQGIGATSDIFSPNATITAPSLQDNDYTITFSGNGLIEGETFVVTEDGLDPSLFPTVGFSSVSATPEPSSLMLLGTGLTSLGGMYWRRRRVSA